MKNKVLLIVFLFIALSAILLGLGYLQSHIMDGVRAYVRGEGLWAKAQKDAMFHLQEYQDHHSEVVYQQFLDTLMIQHGDRMAREALQQPEPDEAKAYEGFLLGGNHPEDIDAMIWFFRHFEHFPYMREAISIWEQADGEIEYLQKKANELRVAMKRNDAAQLELLHEELEVIYWDLAKLEFEFSLVLSEGARWVKSTLLITTLTIALVMLVVVLMITRRIIAGIAITEQELRISENRFKGLYDTDILGIIDWDASGHIIDANESFLNIVGYSRNDLESGKINWRDLTPAEYKQRDDEALNEVLRYGYCKPFEKQFYHKDGHKVAVMLGAALLGGEQQKGICFVLDQSERYRAEMEMRLSATVFDSSSNGILITDSDLKTIKVNSAFSDICGYSLEQLIGVTPELLQPDLITKDVYWQIYTVLKESGSWKGEIMIKRRGGTIVPIDICINAVYDQAGEVRYYVAICVDISERKRAEVELKRRAHYDHLTHLANRSSYEDLLHQAILRANQNDSIIAVLFIDLDMFKPVNDTYGHKIGDKLLNAVAERIVGSVRENDTVARFGGDEFTVIIEELDSKSVAGDIARNIIQTIGRPYNIDGISINIGCSIGICIYPDDHKTSSGLTHCADNAMYLAKQMGKNRYMFSDADDATEIPEDN